MTERDERIGRAIVALRGDTSQAAVADAMRQRGWKWSQATVWSIEKGERPLRLLEASDLAEVLDVQIEDFFGDKASARQEAEFRRLQSLIYRQVSEVGRATERVLVAQDELRKWAEENTVKVPQDAEEAKRFGVDSREWELHHCLNWVPNEAASVVEERHERRKREGEEAGAYGIRRLLKEMTNGEYPEEG